MNNQEFRPTSFSILPAVIKNLLIINGIFFIASYSFKGLGIDLDNYLGWHYPTSKYFYPHQFITYMFMHGGISHIFFNMFALWMFGNILENVWGPKRFLIYYMVTGIGAAVIQMVVTWYQINELHTALNQLTSQSMLLTDDTRLAIQRAIYIKTNTPVIGASGAVFGILLAFGMLFPNTLIYIYFAIPIKAKWFVILYGLFELYGGVVNKSGDNVAHYAHLGGMIFGFFLIIYWKRQMKKKNFL